MSIGLPASHLAGQQAVLAIQRLFVNGGCLSETIQHDYGEDLHLQPSIGGMAEHFRIFVQVKGFDSRTAQKSKSVRVRVDHLRRWNDLLYPTLICAHDIRTGNSYFTSARRFRSRWESWLVHGKTRSIPLLDFEPLNSENIDQVIWKARFEYYLYQVYITMGDFYEWRELRTENDDLADQPFGMTLLMSELLVTIGILVEGGLSSRYLKILQKKTWELSSKKEAWPLFSPILLSIMGFMVECYQINSVPYTVLKWATETVGYWLQSTHPEEWTKHSQQLSSNWLPFKTSLERVDSDGIVSQD